VGETTLVEASGLGVLSGKALAAHHGNSMDERLKIISQMTTAEGKWG